MHDYQRQFLRLCLDQQVLRFGDFTLKSGRHSPYFFNLGNICTGAALASLGQAYAHALGSSGVAFDMLFGPAYKGIALAAATSMALAAGGRDVPWSYNRKETKDHGEGGVLVGAPLVGQVVIVDDVLTAGTATREALQRVAAQGARPAAVLVAMDRCERGRGDETASAEISAEFGIPVIAIATVHDLIELTATQPELRAHASAIEAWRDSQMKEP